jgi:hypothetical protein
MGTRTLGETRRYACTVTFVLPGREGCEMGELFAGFSRMLLSRTPRSG